MFPVGPPGQLILPPDPQAEAVRKMLDGVNKVRVTSLHTHDGELYALRSDGAVFRYEGHSGNMRWIRMPDVPTAED